MKKLLSICSGIMFGLSADAVGFQFFATNLPCQSGLSNCCYFSTNNLKISALLALVTNSSGLLPPESGPTWDFSQLPEADETVMRTDIISPTNGMDGDAFPAAAYAEQDTMIPPAPTDQDAWRYYGITNQGRLYYGSFVTNTQADGLAAFYSPTLDIPFTVTNGQTWTRTVAWDSTIYAGLPFAIHYEFSDISAVDAQGTLILPNGVFTALRVHETHGYKGTYFGMTEEIVTNQYYYWLVPELGVAVQITIYGNNEVDSEIPPFTNSVERMFYASYFTNPPVNYPTNPNVNLHIRLQSGAAILNWIPLTNAISQVSTGYQVRANGSLASTNWWLLGLTSGTNWTDALTPTQRFYRVFGLP